MSTFVRRYKFDGVDKTILGYDVSGIVDVSHAKGAPYLDITGTVGTTNTTVLDEQMLPRGWRFVEADPPADIACTVESFTCAKLGSNASIGTSFEDVCTLTVSTRGGSKLAIVACAVASAFLVGGGDIQVTVTGGSVSETSGTAAMGPVGAGGSATLPFYVDLPATGNRTTYTVKLQAKRDALATLTLLAGSTSIAATEFKA